MQRELADIREQLEVLKKNTNNLDDAHAQRQGGRSELTEIRGASDVEPHRETISIEIFAKEVLHWVASGCPAPPTPLTKICIVGAYAAASGFARFIETGTHHGRMINFISRLPIEIDTIELGESLYTAACSRFKWYRGVRCHLGDSSVVIDRLLSELVHPAIFWLDAHYSEGDTARGNLETPILAEVRAIARHHIHGHVILIDDVRLFGRDDYPPISALREILQSTMPDHIDIVRNDIFAFAPAAVHDRAVAMINNTLEMFSRP